MVLRGQSYWSPNEGDSQIILWQVYAKRSLHVIFKTLLG